MEARGEYEGKGAVVKKSILRYYSSHKFVSVSIVPTIPIVPASVTLAANNSLLLLVLFFSYLAPPAMQRLCNAAADCPDVVAPWTAFFQQLNSTADSCSEDYAGGFSAGAPSSGDSELLSSSTTTATPTATTVSF